MNKIPSKIRKKFFDLLCSNSSPDFARYLRAYESLPDTAQERFEVSCELIKGIRVDSMRLAIECLGRQDVIRWLSVCRREIPSIQEILFDDPKDKYFGIGLADYPSRAGNCRIKIYNFYGPSQPPARKADHIERLFSLFNIPDDEFRKDRKRFKEIQFSGVDWDGQGRPMIKVYFGFFPLEDLFGSFSEILTKKEILCYDILRKRGFLPEMFIFCARYSHQGRVLRTDMRYQTRNVSHYLRIFDQKREASKFFVDLYRLFHDLNLEYISMEWVPLQKIQIYINFNYERSLERRSMTAVNAGKERP